MPFLRRSQDGGRIQRSPFASASNSSLGKAFEGGPWSDAGPWNATPVRGSYMLPWHGHAPAPPIIFEGSLLSGPRGKYFQRHHKCRHTMLYSLNDEMSSESPPSSFGSLISCQVLNDSLFRTGSSDLGYITTSELFRGNVWILAGTFPLITTLVFSATVVALLGKNLPQSTKGVNVITVPAAAINFRKSRLDTFRPTTG